MTLRWSDYFLTSKFPAFWSERLREGGANVCLITGIGFDPRCRSALNQIMAVGRPEQVAILGLRFRTGADLLEPARALNQHSETNLKALLSTGVRNLGIGEIQLQDENRFTAGGPNAVRYVASQIEVLRTFRHVVVDISGMPRSVFYPTISYLCNRVTKESLTTFILSFRRVRKSTPQFSFPNSGVLISSTHFG